MWTPEETNRHYGHAENCVFGKENSGMCNCGRGFAVSVPPQMNAGELDGECLIAMNNVAVGFKPK